MSEDRRHESRILTDDAGTLHVTNPASSDRFDIRVLNTSDNGIGIYSDVFLPAGAEVMVHWSQKVIFGEIRYCIPNGQGFRAGMRIRRN